MDTVYLKPANGANTIGLNDSLMNQLKLVTNHYTSGQDHFDYSVLLPLVAAIVGGIIAIGGQWVIKTLELKRTTHSEIKEIVSTLTKLKTQLHFYFSSYAYCEQNTEYQYHQYKMETDDAIKKKLLDEHYKSNTEMLIQHKLIVDTIADFVGRVKKCSILVKGKISFDEEVKAIEAFEFGYCKEYCNLPLLIADDQVSADIKELTETYRGILMAPLSAIINKCSTL